MLINSLMKGKNRIISNLSDEEYERFLDKFFEENVIFIGDKEFEDAFSSKYLAQVLNNFRPKENGQEWLEMDIEKIKNSSSKFSDELITEASKHSHNKLTKPELGVFLAENIINEEVPSKVKQLFDRIREKIKC